MQVVTSIDNRAPGTLVTAVRRAPGLYAVLGVFVLIAIYINPIRETGLDDDWVYALMVRDLDASGIYRAHEWSSANLPFQAYWGLAFTKLFGMSFISLRLSTLCLAGLGLGALYGLAREHGLNDRHAALAMLGLLASPLALRYSFNFNTDGPFLMCLMIALYAYTRGLRVRSYGWMIAGSVVAAAATLTRQFGVALPGGLVLLWLLARRRRDLALVACGVVLPVLAAAWQVWFGALMPTEVQQRDVSNTSQYLAHVPTLLTNAVLVRPAVILHYLVLFSLPLALLTLLTIVHRDRRKERLRISDLRVSLLVGALVVGGVLYGRWAHQVLTLMPFVQWELTELGAASRVVLTIATTAGAIIYGTILVRRYLPGAAGQRTVTESQWLLDTVTLCLLAQQVLFYKFGDRYLIVFLPYVLIVVGRYAARATARVPLPVVLGFAAMLLVSAGWTRNLLAEGEAEWSAAERLRATGVSAREIFGSTEWNFFNGSLRAFMSDTGRSTFPSDLRDYWYRWAPDWRRTVRFLVVRPGAPLPGAGYVTTDDVPFTDALFRDRHVYVVEQVRDLRR